MPVNDLELVCLLDVLGFESLLGRLGLAGLQPKYPLLGASFGPSFGKPGFNDGFHLNTVLPYESHYKDPASEYATGMTVDWPRRWRESRKSDPRPVLRSLDHDPSFSRYYEQTARFIDF